MTKICSNREQTKELAFMFAKTLKKYGHALVLFEGELGSGKTTFISNVVAALDKKTQPSSPTFNIINQYSDNIFHVDLYRIKCEKELINTAFWEIIRGENFVFIEWAEKLSFDFDKLGHKVFKVRAEAAGENRRKYTFN